MTTLKAVLLMAMWTAAAGWGLVHVGVGAHFRDPLWAVGTAVAFLVVWMVDFAIFFKVAGNRPWEWFKT
jgi:hypothetical protein